MGRKLVIYLDTCIYGRPFDWPQTPKIRAEANAVDTVLKKRERGELRIIGSAAASFEIGQITNAAKRKTIDAYYRKAITETTTPTTQIKKRVGVLMTAGLGDMDAAHLAIAEDAGAGFLLTVDKDFIKKCNDLNLTIVKVMNPTTFVKGGYL
ncbi:MAG: hypothetical protein LBB74_06055 [Chitinispirillales bacterium]|jgi:predicted nucleic acid-binding protein|nr:hypothetical protein [Chitinispirillales bacterium]